MMACSHQGCTIISTTMITCNDYHETMLPLSRAFFVLHHGVIFKTPRGRGDGKSSCRFCVLLFRSVGHDRMCRGVIIADTAKLMTLKITRMAAYIFVVCKRNPPEPDVFIMGCVRPGSTCGSLMTWHSRWKVTADLILPRP